MGVTDRFRSWGTKSQHKSGTDRFRSWGTKSQRKSGTEGHQPRKRSGQSVCNHQKACIFEICHQIARAHQSPLGICGHELKWNQLQCLCDLRFGLNDDHCTLGFCYSLNVEQCSLELWGWCKGHQGKGNSLPERRTEPGAVIHLELHWD